MKKILLFVLLFGCTSLTVKMYGQACTGGANSCNLLPQDVQITIVGAPDCSVPGQTTITFDVNFKIDANDGNKVIYFHSWLVSNYPSGIGTTYFPCNGSGTEVPFNAGAPGNLGNAIGLSGTSVLDIGLNNNASLPVGQTQAMGIRASNGYAPDPTVVLISNTGPAASAPAMTVTKTLLANGLDSISAKNVVVTIAQDCFFDPPTNSILNPVNVKTLIWATNASDGVRAQCWAANIGQSFNDPSLSIVPLCGEPNRQYSFSITTGNIVSTQFDYKVYMHDPLNVAPDKLIHSGTVNLIAPANPTFNSGTLTITEPGYCCISPWSEWDMRLEVTSPSFSNTISTPNVNVGCATLPVNLKLFTASRKTASTVDLKWETAQEENSKGFDVQRKLSNGGWQTIDFVPTKAINGNSSLPLAYEFTDYNNAKGISQYRLRQLDIDGKQFYSQIRAVRGEGQKGKTIIYPNPSGDGKVNIVFENSNSIRDVSLMDVSGKTLKQWKGVTNNNIQIDNLNAGFYTVRIVDTETGEQVVEKFIVNKR